MDAKPALHPKIVVGSGLLCKRGARLADTLRLGSFNTSWLETESSDLFKKSQNTFQVSFLSLPTLQSEKNKSPPVLANSVCIVTHRLCFFSIFVRIRSIQSKITYKGVGIVPSWAMEQYPCFCLCLGLDEHMTWIIPRRFTILQDSHLFFTDDFTFIVPSRLQFFKTSIKECITPQNLKLRSL